MIRFAVAFAWAFIVEAVPWMVPMTPVVGIVFVCVTGSPPELWTPRTFTVIVQIPGVPPPDWAGIVPFVSVMTCVPATAVTTPGAQVVLALGVAATKISSAAVLGRLSVNDTFTRGVVLVFVKVIVKVDKPPGLIIDG